LHCFHAWGLVVFHLAVVAVMAGVVNILSGSTVLIPCDCIHLRISLKHRPAGGRIKARILCLQPSRVAATSGGTTAEDVSLRRI
jgi:hypothetical protein